MHFPRPPSPQFRASKLLTSEFRCNPVSVPNGGLDFSQKIRLRYKFCRNSAANIRGGLIQPWGLLRPGTKDPWKIGPSAGDCKQACLSVSIRNAGTSLRVVPESK